MPPHRHLGSMCEGGRRTSNCIGLTPEVHGCDKTVAHSEYVENLAVRKNIPFKALDELVHPDAGLASIFLGHCKRFDITDRTHSIVESSRRGSVPFRRPCRPPMPWASLRPASLVHARAMSRLVNAEYACAIRVLVSVELNELRKAE